MKLIILRLFIGLAQGIAIYLFHSPAVNAPIWFWELYLIPLILILGVGNLRLKTLLIWSVTATILLYGFSVYNIWQRGLADIFTGKVGLDLAIFAMISVFIVHILVAASDRDRRFMAYYPTYFDISWKITMQVFLTALFVAFCWKLLFLGSFLFKLIGLDFFGKIIAHSWFGYPATAIMSSVAFHITDVQVKLVRGMRTLLLTLMSWLLPLLTLIMLGFLISLYFTGFIEPVQPKHSTTTYLLIASSILILLINAAYQDGKPQRIVPRLLCYTGSFAALILLPVVALCFYCLILRIEQWGWTDSRIMATAWLLIITAYALSYTWAVFAKGPWLKKIEYSNFSIAILIVVIMSALMSPIADPARLSVANQMQHLQSGRIKSDQFDFKYISSHGQRFGQEALQKLKNQHIQDDSANPDVQWKKVALVMVAHTPNRQLPQSFQRQDWQDRQYIGIIPECLNHMTGKCDAWVMDLNQDRQDEILILQRERFYGFAENSSGKWDVIGRWDIPYKCEKTMQAALAGKFQTLPPRWPDLQIHGVRLDFQSNSQINCQ